MIPKKDWQHYKFSNILFSKISTIQKTHKFSSVIQSATMTLNLNNNLWTKKSSKNFCSMKSFWLTQKRQELLTNNSEAYIQMVFLIKYMIVKINKRQVKVKASNNLTTIRLLMAVIALMKMLRSWFLNSPVIKIWKLTSKNIIKMIPMKNRQSIIINNKSFIKIVIWGEKRLLNLSIRNKNEYI